MIFVVCILLTHFLIGSDHEVAIVDDPHSPHDVHIDFAIIEHGPHIDRVSEEDLATIIVDGFLTHSSHKLSPMIKTILIERIKREHEEVKITLSRVAQAHTPLQNSSDPVGVKLAEIFTDAMEEALDMHEKKSQEKDREIESRCKKTTTILLVGGLTLAGTALGALVSALITNAVSS